jgi:hypothetical protein
MAERLRVTIEQHFFDMETFARLLDLVGQVGEALRHAASGMCGQFAQPGVVAQTWVGPYTA